jgi:hypothetical protein
VKAAVRNRPLDRLTKKRRNMDKPSKFRSAIPELAELLDRYGCTLKDRPAYVLIGTYDSKVVGYRRGIFGFTSVEFHAYLMQKEINKNGHVVVLRTEHHPEGGPFCLERYKERIRERGRTND